MIRRPARKLLGVVCHNYLRETGILQIQDEFDVAVFAEPSSALHRIARFSWPISSIDLSDRQFLVAVRKAKEHGIVCDGFLSTRDWNVCAAVKAAATVKRPPTLSRIECLERVRSKAAVRHLINKNLSPKLHTKVEFKLLETGVAYRGFKEIAQRFISGGAAILKPDRGSGKYHIHRIEGPADIDTAWEGYRKAADFRGGAFILERIIEGVEYPVDSIVSSRGLERVYVSAYLPRVKGRFFERGIVVPSGLSTARLAEIQELSAELHRVLGLRNIVSHVEIILPPQGKPAIVEVNPRLAGDMMQELYRLVYGVRFYQIAARLALGQAITSDLLETRESLHGNATIIFSAPVRGRVELAGDPTAFLRSSDERFGLVFPKEKSFEGTDTNDNRPAYMLAVGEQREQMIARAEKALGCCVRDPDVRSQNSGL